MTIFLAVPQRKILRSPV